MNANLSRLSQNVTSCLEITEKCIEKIGQTLHLNAYVTLTSELAQKRASDADKRRQNGSVLGPLDGVPIAVKDNFSTAGIKTTCASQMLANYVPSFNATVVQRLINNGAVLMGKTNMDEFGMGSGCVDSIYGPTINPWKAKKSSELKDLYIAGGSSGGSAVAVATGTCYGALGSDTGGSTRNPSARCGVVGLKPTYGLLSRYGLIPLTNSMDVPGIMAANCDDVTTILNAIAGHDPLDSTCSQLRFDDFKLPAKPSIAGLRIGVPVEYESNLMSVDVKNTWRNASQLLGQLGASICPVNMPHTKYAISCYSVLNCCEVASNFARYDGVQYGLRSDDETSTENMFAKSRHEGFSEVVRGRILAGNYFLLKENYDKYFLQALKLRRLICLDFESVFKLGIDLLLTPVTLSDAPTFEQWSQKDNRQQASIEDYCTEPASMAGLPAVSVPFCLSSNGLPIGIQLIGHSFKEEQLLTAAKLIELNVNFPKLDV